MFKKFLHKAPVALFAALVLCACGDVIGIDDDVDQEPDKQEQIAPLLAKSKWEGVLTCKETVKVAVGTYNDYKLVDSLITCRDTIRYDFGVDVSYPTFSKSYTQLEGPNKDKTGYLDMWFDYEIKDKSVELRFRSFPPGDPGRRILQMVDADHMMAEERGVQFELKRIK